MREFVFALEYDPGTNPVADVLAAHPATEIRSLSCHVTPETLWRVDHVEGPPAALEALEEAYSEFVADCLVRDDCGADCEIQVLDRSRETLVVYTYWERTDICSSVPHIALEYLGEGVLFETVRDGRRYRWRIVLGSDAPIGEFFDALGEEVGDCAGMDVLRVTELDPEHSEPGTNPAGSLPPEQRAALRAAVEYGYYETPREIDLEDLATKLEIPRSTLSYRLRRAEAALATTFVDADESIATLAGPSRR